jgi:hypothetical protein
MRDNVSVWSVVVMPLVLLTACAPDGSSEDQSSDEGAELVSEDVGLISEALDPPGPIDTVTLNITSDTSVRSSAVNKNFGTAANLDINRSFVAVDATALTNAMPMGDFVESAKLRLTLVPTSTRRLQRNLNVHRVTKAWQETKATWNCAVDSNTGNSSADCSGATKWATAGGEYASPATCTAIIPSSRTGVVECDVTADVRLFKNDINAKNYGWLLKTGIGNGGEVADFASRESSTAPQLVLKIRRCGGAATCDDGIDCSQESFSFSCTDGLCDRAIAPAAFTCQDGNACTVADHCSGVDYNCVSGTPAPADTACGDGGTCDGAGHCIE